MSDCVFCRIATKEIPAQIVYEDDLIMAFHDVAPQAPVHILIISKKHIVSLDNCHDEDEILLGHMLNKVRAIAKTEGMTNGYRVVINTGDDGMQTVQHLHFHLLGKRQMTWPPG